MCGSKFFKFRACSAMIPLMLGLIAAGPSSNSTSEELIRAGNEAFARGDNGFAEACYRQAAERSVDPGLVAFNRGCVLVRTGQFREAELEFSRSLDDQDAPESRRARAWYNRGVCLVKRGGLHECRDAIQSFERCLKLNNTQDETLAADARHNLEIAKLLWAKARAEVKDPPLPGDGPRQSPPEKPNSPNEPKQETGEPNTPNDPNGAPKNKPPTQLQHTTPKQGQTPKSTDQAAPGQGNLPVLISKAEKMELTDEDARAQLRLIARRLEDARRKAATLGPGFPNVLDW